MALIACQTCGKLISDKAKACPGCGTVLVETETEEIKSIYCSECGNEIPVGAETCPNCGCPVDAAKDNEEQNAPQKVEVTAVNLPKMKKRTKRGIIIASVCIIIAIIGGLVGIKVYNDKKAEEAARIAAEAAESYESNLSLISFSMITGGAKAERAGNLIKSVWYNAIYKEHDSATDKYTISHGSFVSDFNDALGNLFADSSFTQTIDEIMSNQSLVAGYMKDLKNPPEGYEDAYSAVKECYDAYVIFTNLVVNPTGSLQTFSTNFNDADTSFVNKYHALQLYLE